MFFERLEGGALDQLLGHSTTYRIAMGPHAGRELFALQTLPDCNEPFDVAAGKVAGFSLHAGVAALMLAYWRCLVAQMGCRRRLV